MERLQPRQAMVWEERLELCLLLKGLQGNCHFAGSLPKEPASE